MSRPTVSQILTAGDYLNADFDPSTLTVAQLQGVLYFHNVKIPAPATKAKLVQLFNDEIKQNAKKLAKDKKKREESVATDDGITDGVTGKPIGGEKPLRRSSRRLSRAPEDEDHDEPPRRDPPKRRRSSAQPNLGPTPSRRAVQQEAPLAEESEPDEEPIRKVAKSKLTAIVTDTPATRAPRLSDFRDDSGWEDNNVFQSGAESSPSKPSPIKRARRRTASPRKPRLSESAPPDIPPSPKKKTRPPPPGFEDEDNPFRPPPQSEFEPILPEEVLRRTPVTNSPFRQTYYRAPSIVKEEEKEEETEERAKEQAEERAEDRVEIPANADVSDISPSEKALDELQVEVQVGEDEDIAEDQTAAISRRLAEGPVARREDQSAKAQSMPLWRKVVLFLVAMALTSAVYNYKEESAQIGYCDTGSDTNAVLEAMKLRRLVIEACNRDNQTILQLPPIPTSSSVVKGDRAQSEEVACPPPTLLPFLEPSTCTPCPAHATCGLYEVKCETGYLMRPPLFAAFLPLPGSPSASSLSDLAWTVLSGTLDGLPGLGSVALPPRCVEDPRRKRNIGALGKAIESVLGQERGKRVCKDEVQGVLPDKEGGDARTWGLEVRALKESMRRKTAPHLLETFDGMFDEAINQLIQWGGVVQGQDAQGRRYLAHQTADLTWDCVLTVKARDVWVAWRARVIGTLAVIGTLFISRIRAARRRIEDKRVAELVQVALDMLRNQELAHHTDPVTAPQPYLSSLQLRDLILQDEHSISTRSRVWDKVERIVESNANVRANLEELPGGDEMRVWRWVGSIGTSPTKRS